MFFRRWTVAAFFVLALPVGANARPPHEGFHTGPYLLGSIGMTQYAWDVNQRTQKQEGDRTEPVAGFIFGWDFFDWLAPELQTLYSTSNNGGRREQLFFINAGVATTLLWQPLLGIGNWNILPFVTPSVAISISSLPGDLDAPDHRLTVFGIGPGIAGGFHVQWKKYIYFGFQAREDFIHTPDKMQEIVINGVSAGQQKIYPGGFHPQFGLIAVFGVHY